LHTTTTVQHGKEGESLDEKDRVDNFNPAVARIINGCPCVSSIRSEFCGTEGGTVRFRIVRNESAYRQIQAGLSGQFENARYVSD